MLTPEEQKEVSELVGKSNTVGLSKESEKRLRRLLDKQWKK